MKMTSRGIKGHFPVKRDGGDRKAPKEKVVAGPSHQEDKDLQILREFDLDHRYGPCTGITRLERWERASKHNLDPPQQVLTILGRNKNDPRYTNNVWSDYCI